MAEGEGFEPPMELPPCQFSKLMQSTALPSLRREKFYVWEVWIPQLNLGKTRLSIFHNWGLLVNHAVLGRRFKSSTGRSCSLILRLASVGFAWLWLIVDFLVDCGFFYRMRA